MWVAFLGLLVNIVLLFCTLDVHLMHYNVPRVKFESYNFSAPAERVVLFVFDGLTSDLLWSVLECSNTTVAKAAQRDGCLGEAIISSPPIRNTGLMAVSTGVEVNPAIRNVFLQFDNIPSVFDSSKSAFFFGPSEVLNIIKNPLRNQLMWASLDRYDPYEMNSAKPLSDQIADLFKYAKNDSKLEERLNYGSTIFYFHLSQAENQLLRSQHCPNSKSGHSIIGKELAVIDEIIELINGYFSDSKTTFLMCSDHGILETDIPINDTVSHLTTPIIAWGAGVKACPTRVNFNQTDMAPLIATLLGIDIPSNSLGRLPRSILNLDAHSLTLQAINNAWQIAALSRALTKQVPQYWTNQLPIKPPQIEQLRDLVDQQKYQEAEYQSDIIIDTSLKHLRYSDYFYRHLILSCHFLIVFAWGIVCLTMLLPKEKVVFIHGIVWNMWLGLVHTDKFNRLVLSKISVTLRRRNNKVTGDEPDENKDSTATLPELPNQDEPSEGTLVAIKETDTSLIKSFSRNFGAILIDFIAVIFAVLACIAIIKVGLPLHFIVYLMLPIFLFWEVASNGYAWITFLAATKINGWKQIVTHSAIVLASVEYIHWSLMYKAPICLPLCVIALVPAIRRNRSSFAASGWQVGLATLAYIVTASSTLLLRGWVLYPGGSALVVATASAIWFMRAFAPDLIFALILSMLQVFALIGQLFGDTLGGYRPNTGVATLEWTVLILGLIAPVVVLFFENMRRSTIQVRLFHIAAALVVPVMALSSSYEPFACIAVYAVMAVWLYVEIPRTNGQEREFGSEDVRRALLGYYFAAIIFLAMGNASWITPFNLSWFRNIIPYTNEKAAVFLLLTKNICGIMILAATLTAITVRSGINLSSFLPMILFLINLNIARIARDLAVIGKHSINLEKMAITHQCKFVVLSKYCSISILGIAIIICFLVCKYVYRIDKIKI